MTDWKQELGNFFKERGVNDKDHEFSKLEEQEIQAFIEAKVKPAYSKLAEELNNYANIKAYVIVSKNTVDSIKENIEFRIDWIMQPKFVYRIKFAKSEKVVIAIGQYSIPDLYGKSTEFFNSDLRNSFALIEEKDILSNFLLIFKSKTELR